MSYTNTSGYECCEYTGRELWTDGLGYPVKVGDRVQCFHEPFGDEDYILGTITDLEPDGDLGEEGQPIDASYIVVKLDGEFEWEDDETRTFKRQDDDQMILVR